MVNSPGRIEDGLYVAQEAFVGRFGDGFEPVQVVGGRDHREVSHGGREHRQLGSHIDPGAIPAQQDVDGIGMTQVTQEDLAKQLRSSQSRIAKMEASDATVSMDFLVRSLLVLGATTQEVGRVIARS